MQPKLKSVFGLLFLLCALVALMAPEPARAQMMPGLYSFLPGGTAQLPAGSTNAMAVTTGTGSSAVTTTNGWTWAGGTNAFTINVSQFDYAGFTFSAKGLGAGATGVYVQLFKSCDNGNSFEALPSFAYNNLTVGTGGYTTNANLDLHGVTHLALQVGGGVNGTTNTFIGLMLKAPTTYQLAPMGGGKSPGTPIAVPNFP